MHTQCTTHNSHSHSTHSLLKHFGQCNRPFSSFLAMQWQSWQNLRYLWKRMPQALHSCTPSRQPSRQYGVFLAEQEAQRLRVAAAWLLFSCCCDWCGFRANAHLLLLLESSPPLSNDSADAVDEDGLIGRFKSPAAAMSTPSASASASASSLSLRKIHPIPLPPGHKHAFPFGEILKIIPGSTASSRGVELRFGPMLLRRRCMQSCRFKQASKKSPQSPAVAKEKVYY